MEKWHTITEYPLFNSTRTVEIGWSPRRMCIVDLSMAMSSTPVPPTYENFKPRQAQQNCRTFPSLSRNENKLLTFN